MADGRRPIARTVNCIVDERTLREVYLLPFEAVSRAGAWSMMAAYNLVNGVHCTDNAALIGAILREEWGWDGVLMSDWEATHDTLAGARAGLDLEMPGPAHHFGPHLAAAVRRGDVDEETLNCAALRILTLAARATPCPWRATPAATPARPPETWLASQTGPDPLRRSSSPTPRVRRWSAGRPRTPSCCSPTTGSCH